LRPNKSFTVTPSDAKGYFSMEQLKDREGFITSDEKYALFCWDGDDSCAILWYVDRDVTLTFNHYDDDYDGTTNISAKKGWNYIYSTYNGITSSQTLPKGFKWEVVDAMP